MKYAKSESGQIISGEFSTLWPSINANDRNTFAQNYGFVPVQSKILFDPIFEQLNPTDVYFSNGAFYDVSIIPASLESVKAELLAKVLIERRIVEEKGISYTFPDGVGVVQTRNEIDIRNVQAQVLAALVLSSKGIITPVLGFRDENNTTHSLTPNQMISMGMAVSSTISSLYDVKWAKDDQIKKLTSVEAAHIWFLTNL